MTTNNEQLRRENNILNTDNKQLRTNVDTMKDQIIQLKAKHRDEIGQLTTQMNKISANNEKQIKSQSSEIAKLRTENQQLKVSHWSESLHIASYSYTIPNIHILRTLLCADNMLQFNGYVHA